MLEQALLVTLATGAFLVIIGGVRASREIKSPADYFSFGSKSNDAGLRRAFTVTNSTFTTSFVTLFLLASSTGLLSLAIPIGFVAGIIFYALAILPRQIPLLATNQRYPSLLETATGSRQVRSFCALFMLVNLLLFTFAELQGLQIFLREFYPQDSIFRSFLPFGLVMLMAWHVAKSGYRAVIGNDKIQFHLIVIGSACLIISMALAFRDASPEITAKKVLVTTRSVGFGNIILLAADAIAGFLFAQLIYYDNWQRLAFFISGRLGHASHSDQNNELKLISKAIRKQYLYGALILGAIYTIPIALAFALLGTERNGTATIASIANYFKEIWSIENIIWIPIGPILFVGSILFMLAALVSTAEVYIVGTVGIFIEDILKKDSSAQEDNATLDRARFAAAGICFLLVPFLFVEPNFEKLFTFMFYSANGLVGPVACLLFQKKISPTVFFFSIIFAMGYCLPPLINPDLSEAFPLPGLVVVTTSLLVTLIPPLLRKDK